MYNSSGFTNEQGEGGYSGGGADVIGAIIGAGAGLYDSHQNRKLSRENTDKTIAANKAEAELAYQRQVDMWNKQNLYNSPQAQMQRFMQAGLNPHLIYGQGNSGNASTPPAYQPPTAQYRYESGNYGAAIGSILPTLMAVGTWMQNMRLSQLEYKEKEASIESRMTGTERARQMIDFLRERNPQLLKEGGNKLDLFPYQRSMADFNSNIARTKLFELEQDFRYKYGESLFDQMGSAWEPKGKFSEIGGMKKLQYLQQAEKNVGLGYSNKILDAKSSMTDFNITDPQALMQLVLSGVMGLAGQTIKMRQGRSQYLKPKPGRSLRQNPRNWDKFQHD